MVIRSLICFVTVCGTLYGSTEGSTGRAKPGKPCGARVLSRNSRSNTVSKAPVALRSSPRDNKLFVYSPLTVPWAVFFFSARVEIRVEFVYDLDTTMRMTGEDKEPSPVFTFYTTL